MVFLFFLAFLRAQILDCTTFYPDFNTQVQWAKTSEVDCPWVFKGSAGAMRNSLLEGQAILQSQFQGFNLMACSFRLERKRGRQPGESALTETDSLLNCEGLRRNLSGRVPSCCIFLAEVCLCALRESTSKLGRLLQKLPAVSIHDWS